MSKSAAVRSAGWANTKDLSVAAGLCEYFNRGRLYEIFWEYCDLTPKILSDRGARSWLYYENDEICGFALGRLKEGGALRMGGTFIFEEVWAPCEGLSNELGHPDKRDIRRVLQFKKVISSMNCRSQIMIRAAADNQFAHMIARTLQTKWINGLVIARKTLAKRMESSNVPGHQLRSFNDGDQFHMSRIHEKTFRETFDPRIYKDWATRANCETIVNTYNGLPVGFIIAERRRCGSVGDFIIAVEPAHQGKGIGSILLGAAINAFIDMGVKSMIADYLILNIDAHRLYQKFKFKPERIYNYFLYRR